MANAFPAPILIEPKSSPSSTEFPLVVELARGLQPWQAFQRLSQLPYPLFLDSSLKHESLGRYSFVASDPFEILWAKGSLMRSITPANAITLDVDPFAALAQRLALYQAEPLGDLPPFQGGAAGLFGYDLCHHLERLPRPRFDEFQIPDMAVGFYDWVLAFDHALEKSWLISSGFPETDPNRRRRRAAQRIQEVKRHLNSPPNHPRLTTNHAPLTTHPSAPTKIPGLLSNLDRKSYLREVERAIEYIRAGDCFQVNLAQRLLWPAREPAIELYGRLRARNPSTFGGFFDFGDFTIASASPERFLQVLGGEVETRPIKGTRQRGQNLVEDRDRIRELDSSPKDRAENVMIVDLLRNDLGRVCEYNSVRVPAVCRVETYPFVHHLVSEVRGRLREGLGPIDLLKAAFPGGSVTGAPKIRAMEIIADLEPNARGPYCGSLGYIGFDGSMDINIVIRTFTVGRGWVQFPVGGGIVADSDPENEYEETWHKAAGLLEVVSGEW